MEFEKKLQEADQILKDAITEHEPSHVFGLFSGGHDSLCATHVASRNPNFSAAVHINTGIGIEQTRDFVRKTCEEEGWPLLEYKAEDEGFKYEDIVLEHGFPGPGAHRYMYIKLKERAVCSLVREHKTHWKDRILLVTGVRRQESMRRMGSVEAVQRKGAQLWVAPLINWTGLDKNQYMQRFQLPRNEVVDLIHMSGECLCGAYAKPGELEYIASCGFTDVANQIKDLEQKARNAGIERCAWGARSKDEKPEELTGPLCHGCDSRFEMEDE